MRDVRDVLGVVMCVVLVLVLVGLGDRVTQKIKWALSAPRISKKLTRGWRGAAAPAAPPPPQPLPSLVAPLDELKDADEQPHHHRRLLSVP